MSDVSVKRPVLEPRSLDADLNTNECLGIKKKKEISTHTYTIMLLLGSKILNELYVLCLCNVHASFHYCFLNHRMVWVGRTLKII